MGYSVLMQWTAPQPTGRMSVSDLVLLKVLEHYNITHPLRSTIQLRTFRAAFPAPDGAAGAGAGAGAGATRVLTTITYSQHLPPVREVPMPLGARDDVTYLFLEDRGVPSSSTTASGASNSAASPTSASPATAAAPADAPEGSRDERRHMMLAVRPATSVMPTLQQLLSPFVLGLSKSARVQASTTAQAAQPTPLSGTPFVLTSLAFPPAMTGGMPPVALSLHVLPGGTAQTIFLEAEWDAPMSGEGVVSGARRDDGKEDGAERKDTSYPVRVDREILDTDSVAAGVLKEFLSGCVPEGGERRWWVWDREDPEGWVGIEKNKRTAFLLARALREAGFI